MKSANIEMVKKYLPFVIIKENFYLPLQYQNKRNNYI